MNVKSGIFVSLVLPCYNEIEHIESSLSKIMQSMNFFFEDDAYEIILVDDGSEDGTREWLNKQRLPNVRVHFNESNLGRGGAVKKGIELSRGTTVGFMDIDCEVSEAYLPRFVQAIASGADLAVGFRIYRVSLSPYVLLRHFLSLGYKKLVQALMETSVADSEVGYKFFSRRFADYIVSTSKFDDWFWDTETCHLAELSGLKIDEIVVAFCRNPKKTSTVHLVRDSVRYIVALQRYRSLISNKVYARLSSARDGQDERAKRQPA